jgi:hypothetical protein
MKWVLGTDGYLHVPNELHVRTEACRKVWKDSSVVPFSVYTFSNSLVLDSLLFIQEPTHQSVLNAMESISQAADLHQQSHFSVEQATCLYFFLNEKAQKDPSNSSEIKKAFQERNLIFIERERSDPMTDHGGRFCSAHDVFWSAKSAQAFFGSKSSSFFTNASNNVLETMYPSQLCSFFVEICGIDKKPSVQWMCDQLLWRQQQKKKTPTFKKLLPLLRHLSKQIKQENLDQKQILLIKRTLATAVPLQSWLPIVQEELTKGASVSLSPEMLANVVYALSEEEKQIQDQVLRLKNKKEKDILFIDLEAHDTVRKLVPLYQALGIQPLCQHVLSRVNSWCQLVSSHSLEEEVTQELVSGLMGVWISCLMSVEDSSNDIKQQIKKTLTMNEHRICPVITSSSALSSIRFVHFTEAYVNDQTDISMEDITAIGVPTVAFTNTFWLTTFMKKKKISKRNKQLKQKAKLYIVLQEALGCKSLQAHLTSSVHFTRTLPSDHDQKKQVEALVQGGLALANRILFHQYPKLYKKYASTIANIKSFLVEGPLDIVYQMKDTQKAIWQREIKNGAYYAPSEQCVYISFATGTSQPFDVIKSQQMYLELMLEILQKIILHFEFVTTISNILYLASFQPEDQVEKWLQEVQKLPPVDFLRKKKRTRDYKEENMLEEEEIKTSLLKRARSIDGIPPVPSSFQTNIYTWQSGFSNSFPPPPPSHNTSFSLIAPPMMSLANTMTQEERTAIGRWGEEFAYRMLVTEYASKQNEVKVVWVNEHEESGEPYDLKMIWTQGKSRKEEYIEVKSTRTTEKGLFEVTINEFEYASIHGSNYSIFRVFNAGNDALCRVLRFRNPVALVRQKKIQLALVLQ